MIWELINVEDMATSEDDEPTMQASTSGLSERPDEGERAAVLLYEASVYVLIL